MKLFPQSWYEAYYVVCALCQIAFWACVCVAVALVIAEVLIRKFIESPSPVACR